MRILHLVAGVAAAALIPTFATAQAPHMPQPMQQMACAPQAAPQGQSAGAAVAGAVLGALLGTSQANQANCARAYGYYDQNGQWHANAVNRAEAAGYYDRDGRWVSGAPNGYYDNNGRWITASADVSAAGYHDRDGRWVPASAQGYYDASGRWIAGAAPGHYENGRWVAGPTTGRYDRDGRWIEGQPAGRQGPNGVWVADAQPGYYDRDGRWRAGQAVGYYDAQGRWMSTGLPAVGSVQAGVPVRAQGQAWDQQASRDIDMWAGAPTAVAGRQAWLGQRIRTGLMERNLSRTDGQRALATLDAINREAVSLRNRRGMLNPRNEAMINAKLDALNASLRWRGAAYSRN